MQSARAILPCCTLFFTLSHKRRFCLLLHIYLILPSSTHLPHFAFFYTFTSFCLLLHIYLTWNPINICINECTYLDVFFKARLKLTLEIVWKVEDKEKQRQECRWNMKIRTVVDLQLDAQNSYLFIYNTFIKIL